MAIFFSPVPRGPGAATLESLKRHVERLAETINRILTGKQNNVIVFTLAANVATTTLTDARIGVNSALQLNCPMTANAAAEIGAGTAWWSTIGNQSAVLTHANAASTDRTFRVTVSG